MESHGYSSGSGADASSPSSSARAAAVGGRPSEALMFSRSAWKNACRHNTDQISTPLSERRGKHLKFMPISHSTHNPHNGRIETRSTRRNYGYGNGNGVLQSSPFTVGGLTIYPDDADDSTNSATTRNNPIRINEENGKHTGMSTPPRIDSTSSQNSFGNGNGNILLQSSSFTVGGLTIYPDDADDSTTTTSATFLASSNILPAARTNNNNSNDKENCKRTGMLPPQPIDNSSNKKRSASSSLPLIQNDNDRESEKAFTTPPAKSYYASSSNNLSVREVEEEQGQHQGHHTSVGLPSVHNNNHSISATTHTDTPLPLSSRSYHATTKDVEIMATTTVTLSGNTNTSKEQGLVANLVLDKKKPSKQKRFMQKLAPHNNQGNSKNTNGPSKRSIRRKRRRGSCDPRNSETTPETATAMAPASVDTGPPSAPTPTVLETNPDGLVKGDNNNVKAPSLDDTGPLAFSTATDLATIVVVSAVATTYVGSVSNPAPATNSKKIQQKPKEGLIVQYHKNDINNNGIASSTEKSNTTSSEIDSAALAAADKSSNNDEDDDYNSCGGDFDDSGDGEEEAEKEKKDGSGTSDRDPTLEEVGISTMAEGVMGDDPSLQFERMIQFRRLFHRTKNATSNTIANNIMRDGIICSCSGVVPRFVAFLQRDDNPALQFEAAGALTDIAAGTSEHTKVVTEAGAVRILVGLLLSPNDDVREQAVWALGTIAFASPLCCDLVLKAGAMAPLSCFSQTLRKIFEYCPQPDLEIVRSVLPTLSRLISSSDDEVLTNACLAIAYLSEEQNEMMIQALIDAGVGRQLVELLSHPSPAVHGSALITVGDFIGGNDSQAQFIIVNDALPCLLRFLSSSDERIRNEACRTIANIIGCHSKQIQVVVDNKIIPPLIQLLTDADFETRNEAGRAILNVAWNGTSQQIKSLVDQGCIRPLLKWLADNGDNRELCTTDIIRCIIRSLNNIFEIGQEEFIATGQSLDSYEQQLNALFEEFKGFFNESTTRLFWSVWDEDHVE